MFNNKLLVRFLLQFIAAYVVLSLLWSPLKNVQAEFFRQKTAFFFGNFKSNGGVVFSKQNQTDEKIVASLFNKQLREEAQTKRQKGFKVNKLPMDSKNIAYLPIILFLSLLFATPISWKRKGWALLWGLILLQLFIFFKLYIKILWSFNGVDWLDVVHLQGFGLKLVSGLNYLFVQHIGTAVIVPVFIWILVSFKKEDKQMLMG